MSTKLSEKPKKRLRLNATARKKQLLDIAIELTAKKGLGNTRHTDIADLANVAVSTVFFYFPTVEQLEFEIIDVVEKSFNSHLLSTLLDENHDMALNQALKEHVTKFPDIVSNQKSIIVILLEWGSRVNHRLWSRYLEYRDKNANLLNKYLIKAQRKGEIKQNTNIDVQATILIMLLRDLLKLYYLNAPEEQTSTLYGIIETSLFQSNR